MIEIKHEEQWDNSEGHHTITIKGHSGYAPIGEDIVCAGVSTLAYTLRARLEEIKAWDYDVKDKHGEMTISCTITPYDQDMEEAVEFAMTGFKLMAKHYPKWVKVIDQRGV